MKTQASLCEISRTLSSALHLPSGTCAFLGEASPEGNLRTSEVQAEGGMRPAEQTLEWRVRPGMDSDLPGEGRPGRAEAWESRPRRGEAQVLQSRVFTHIPENPVTNQSDAQVSTICIYDFTGQML